MPKTSNVPTYASDGRRLGSFTASRVERLLSLSLIVVRRNKRGKIVVAQFRDLEGANPLRESDHAGTKYSFLVRVGPDTRAWQHADLLRRHEIEAYYGELTPAELEKRDEFVRGVFTRVPATFRAKTRSSVHPARGLGFKSAVGPIRKASSRT